MMFEDILRLFCSGDEDSDDGTDGSEATSDDNNDNGDVATGREGSEDRAATDDESSSAEYHSSDEETEGASDIHKACIGGNLHEVKQLVCEDMSLLKSRDRHKRTPLYYACRTKREDIVKYLLQKGAKVNVHDARYATPLHAAVDVTGYDYPGETTIASLKRREVRARKIIPLLLDAGADASESTESGSTPLTAFVCNYFRCQKGPGNIPLTIVKMLLECGDATKNELGKHVTRYAAMFGDLTLLELCLEYGGDINEVVNYKGSLLDAAVEIGSKNFTEELRCRTLKFLLDKGCTRVNHCDDHLTTLGSVAERGFLKCMDVLLSYGARMDIEQPLHYTVWPFLSGKKIRHKKYRKVVNGVIERGSVMDLETDSGISSLWSVLAPTFEISLFFKQSREKDKKLRIERARDFLKIVLHENAVKLPSRKGFQLTMKKAEDGRGMDIMDCPNLWVVPYLYKIGYKILEIEETLEDTDAQDDLSEEQRIILHHITEMKILDLNELCRLELRRLLGSPLSAKVQKLPLPKPMQDYLCMI